MKLRPSTAAVLELDGPEPEGPEPPAKRHCAEPAAVQVAAA